MRIKRMVSALLAAALAYGRAGCGQTKQSARQGTAEHEVLTLTPVSEDKMMITMRAGSGISFKEMEAGIEANFPDVDIVVTNNTWLQDDIDHGCHQDMILAANSTHIEWNAKENLIDLSGERYLQNYYLATLQDSTVNDKIYYLPGPSNIYGIVYNKDMYAEHGWEVPTTLDDFIALCQNIEAADIRAIQPALYYRDAGRQFFTGFTYVPIFAGV